MTRRLLSFTWLACASLAWAFARQSAHAGDGSYPIKIDAGFKFHFNITSAQDAKPQAPWYTYFPYDPNLMAPPPSAPHRTWPGPQPSKATKPSGMSVPMPNYYTPPFTRPAPIAADAMPFLQPVGYSTFQTPSYWYGR